MTDKTPDAHKAALEAAHKKALAALKKKPTAENIRNAEAAKKALADHKARTAGPGERRFKTLLDALAYLKDEGWKVEKSKLYADAPRKIDIEADGTYTPGALDKYARLCLQRIDGSGDGDKGAADRKARLENEILEEKKKKLQRENEKESDRFERRSEADKEFASFAAYTKNAVGPEFIHRAVERLIDAAEGNPKRAPEVIELWLKEVEELFDRHAGRGGIHRPGRYRRAGERMNTAAQEAMFETYRIRPAVREVWKKKEDLTVSEWAARHRRVTMGAHIGPWRNDISPYLVFIMDTWGQPHVREVVICKSPQTGGTEVIFNCEGSAMDGDPSTAMIVMPDQNRARAWANDRIIPMIKQTPRLKRLMTDNPDDIASQRIALANGEKCYMAWSNSTSALSGWPAKRIYFDETDKYPPTVGKEADSISLGEKRVRTFRHTHKIMKVSTPTREDAPIWKALKRCEVEYHYHYRCPDCGHEAAFRLSNLRAPEKLAPEEIRRENLATYECEGCGAQWNDRKKDAAMRGGRWRRVKGKNILRPRRVGFHLSSWLSPDVSLSEIAAAHIVAKTDRAKLIDFYNDYLAEPFIESGAGESVSEAALYDRRKAYAPAGAKWQVPMGACLLTFFCDVQKNRLEGEVVAWGPGYESWGIEYRAFPGDPSIEFGHPGSPWNDLAEFLRKEWLHESGARLRITTAGIDSGYLAPVVYRFVRRRQARRIYATKGSSTRGKPLVSVPSPKSMKKKLKDRYLVSLVTIGTETGKDTLFSWMQIEGGGPGYMHFPDTYGLDYFRMLTAEQAITRYDKAGHPYRVWEEKHSGAPNEALDIRVGNYAVLDLLNPNFEALSAGLKLQAAEITDETPEKTQTVADKPRPSRDRKSNTPGGWMKRWRR